MKRFLIFLMVFTVFPVWAEEAEWVEWKLAKDKNGIQVYTRYTDNSRIKKFKGVTEIRLPDPTALFAVLDDYDAVPKWVHYTHDVEVLEKRSDIEKILRASILLPWPVKDREAVSLSRVTQDPEDLSIKLKYTNATPEFPNVRKGFIRFPEYGSSMLIQWKDKNTAIFTFESYADPGGYLPPFLVNLMATDASYFTLKKLKGMVARPEYQGKRFDYLKFPE